MATSDQAGFADAINNALTPVSDFVSSIIFFSVNVAGVSLPLVVVWLIAAGVIFTFYFRFINLRGFRHAWRLVFRPKSEESGAGEI